MNEDVKNIWLAALRSKKYKQTHHKLRDEFGFCCLGVLCDLSAKGSWVDHANVKLRSSSKIYATSDSNAETVLPVSVRNWAEMKSYDGGFSNNTLAELNDDGKTFDEIADVIEKHWKSL